MTVTIQRNYVNSKIDGNVPDSVFQQLRTELRYAIPGHQFAPAYQKKWGDGYKYLITAKRRVFPSGLLYLVENILQQNQIEYKIVDLRTAPNFSNPIPLTSRDLRDYQQEAEKACLEKKCGIIKIPTGGGKCINPDSYLLTSQGMVQLKDIIPDIALSPGDAVPLEVDLFDRQGWSQSSHLYYDGERDTKTIETSFGYSIEGTPKHRILVIDKEEIKFKYLNEIQEGDIVCIQRNQRAFNQNRYDLSKFKPILNTSARSMRVPKYIDASLALFLGLWVAEGSFHYNGSYIFGFSNKDSELLSFVTDELSKYQIHHQNNIREDGCTDVVWAGCVMSQLLKYIGCSLEKSKYKHIPKAILQSPCEIQREFLRGYISGEGHVRKDRLEIEVSSVSYRLLKEVQLVLLNFGIICSLKKRKRSWTLYMRGQEVVKYVGDIGFFSSDKQRQCYEAIQKYPKRNSNFDTVPVGATIKSVSKSLKNRWVTRKGRKRDIYSVDRFDHTQPTYDWLKSFLKEQTNNIKNQFSEALDLIQNAVLDNFFYDRVVSVRNSRCAVYDFTVPKTHSFFANGFINHNTLLFTSFLGKLNGLKCAVYLRKLDLMTQTIRCISNDLGIPKEEIGQIGGGVISIKPLSVVMIPTAARALGEKYIKYSGHDNDDDDDNTPLTTQQKLDVKEFIETTDCFIVDECFPGNTRILTENGLQTISSLVNQRYSGRVWSYNTKSHRMELQKVTNWYKRKTMTKLCRVKLHKSLNRKDCVTCTENHKFYLEDGSMQKAKNLVPGDVVRTFPTKKGSPANNNSSKGHLGLGHDQMQVALGTLLGDGYLYKYPSGKLARIQWTHCLEQEEYLKWKLEVFGCIDRIRHQRGGFGNKVQVLGRTCGWWQLKRLHDRMYPNGKKVITRQILDNLDELGLAVWVMDDGSWNKIGKHYYLHTDGFSYKEQCIIKKYLKERWNINSNILYGNATDSYHLYITVESSRLLRDIIKPYLHSSMKYKGEVDESVPSIKKDFSFLPYGLVEISCIDRNVNYYGKTKKGHLVFNITVEQNHNYIANGFLVSNCHALSSETAQMVSSHSKKAYYRIGCSATPWRTDGTDILLNAATGPRIIDISASTLIERKFLVPPKVHFYRLKKDWTQHVPGDYQSVYTKFIVENKDRNEKIVKLADYMTEKGERVVILVQRQQHGKVLEEMLQAKGRLAKFIYGESSLTERSLALDQFSAGVLDVLIGSTILNEGIDVPCITALINASGGKSSSSYYQKIGRAIRPFENKTRAIVIDFLDAVKWLDKHSKERIEILKTEPMYQIKIQD